MPKYEKVDDKSIRVTREHTQVLKIADLLGARDQMRATITQIQQELTISKERLAIIEEAIEEAKKLGLDVSGK